MATYHIWKDKDHKFYWTLKSSKNFKIVAMSSESYDSKQGAEESVEWTRANAKTDDIEDHTKNN